MTSLHPVTDPLLWLAYLGSLGLVLFLPGWIGLGRHLRRMDALSRVLLSTGLGLLLAPLANLVSLAGIPLDPWGHVAALCLLALLLPFLPGFGAFARALEEDLPPLRRSEQWGVVILCGAMAAVLVQGFAAFVAPSHLHDASNHSFMIARILETRSVAQAQVFGAPWRNLGPPYWMGWHVAAAHAGAIAGVAPYVSAWFMGITCATLLPAALSMAWRRLGFGSLASVLAGGFLVADFFMPAGLFSWGGFGALAGFFAVAPAFLLISAALRVGRLAPAPLLLGGVALYGLVFIHFTEVLVTLLLVGLALGPLPRSGRLRPAPTLKVLAGLLGILILLAGPSALEAGRSYLDQAMDPPRGAAEPLGLVLQQTLLFAGGYHWPLRILLVVAVAVGLVRRRTRPVAVAALFFLVLYITLRALRDPVSQALASPFYRQPSRVLYPLLFLTPPLLAWPFAALRRQGQRGWMRWVSAAALAVLVAGLWGPGAAHNVRNLRQLRAVSAFNEDDYRLARELGNATAPPTPIANQWDDGSFWAAWISHRTFLDPAAWGLSRWRGIVPQLIQRPWPAEVQELRERGADLLWVSDETVPFQPAPPLDRTTLREDPRFEEVLQGESSSVFRILWNSEARP